MPREGGASRALLQSRLIADVREYWIARFRGQ
jgi:hypothetical protein